MVGTALRWKRRRNSAKTWRPSPSASHHTTAGRGRNVTPPYLYAEGPESRQKITAYLEQIRPYVPEGRQLLIGKASRRSDNPAATPVEAWRTYLVFSVAQVDGSMIRDAQVSLDPQDNSPYVQLQFNRRGAEVFDRVTNENVKKRFAIVLDEKGERFFISWDGWRKGQPRGWESAALTVFHIPASERVTTPPK